MESAGHRHEVDISPHSFDHTINTLSASRLPGLDVSGIDSEHIEGCVEGHTGMSSHNSLESITNSLYNIQNGRASSPLGHSPIPMNQLENIGSFGQHSPVSGSINDDLEYSKKQLQSYQSQSPNSQTLTPRTSTPVSSGKRRFPCRDPTCDQTFSTRYYDCIWLLHDPGLDYIETGRHSFDGHVKRRNQDSTLCM